MGVDRETIATYDAAAEAFAAKFRGIGSRVMDIDLAFELAGNPTDARVVEIGCGDGRDAAEIVKRTKHYEGFDPSKGLLELARRRNLNASFVEADALGYQYPDNTDIVFAFASLLHVSKTDLTTVFRKVHHALRKGGIPYLSLKEREAYGSELMHDELGDRRFYYYDVPTIEEAAGPGFETISEHHLTKGHTDWLELALQKA